MPEQRDDDRPRGRLEELMGAALGDDLSPAERVELDALLDADPAARRELAEATSLTRTLSSAASAEPPASLRDRVLAATSTAPGTTAAPAVPRQRRALAAVAAVVAALVVGAGGFGLARVVDRPPQGPAGTLGAQEPVTFTGVPEGVTVSASVVAHTWGTETVFSEVSGLVPGRTYDVVLLADDGTEVPTGSFLAVADALDCRMTSATLCGDVTAIEVRDADGAEVMASSLPPV